MDSLFICPGSCAHETYISSVALCLLEQLVIFLGGGFFFLVVVLEVLQLKDRKLWRRCSNNRRDDTVGRSREGSGHWVPLQVWKNPSTSILLRLNQGVFLGLCCEREAFQAVVTWDDGTNREFRRPRLKPLLCSPQSYQGSTSLLGASTILPTLQHIILS